MSFSVEEIKKEAKLQVEKEEFDLAVQRQKIMIRWPWYKKLFPFKIKLQIIDLRKG